MFGLSKTNPWQCKHLKTDKAFMPLWSKLCQYKRFNDQMMYIDNRFLQQKLIL